MPGMRATLDLARKAEDGQQTLARDLGFGCPCGDRRRRILCGRTHADCVRHYKNQPERDTVASSHEHKRWEDGRWEKPGPGGCAQQSKQSVQSVADANACLVRFFSDGNSFA